MNIVMDLETVPVQDAALIADLQADMNNDLAAALAAVKAPGNYKDAAKIAEYEADARAKLQAEHAQKVADAIAKTSFDGGMGQVVCIGWACGDGAAQVMSAPDLSADTERAMLAAWFDAVDAARGPQAPRLIGHNIIGFDLPFLWKRCMVLGVKPPHWLPRSPKPWGDEVQDTMLLWDGSQRAGGSMERICRLLGIPGKGGITGADVWPMVQAGRIKEVADYCRGDVERTRAMYARMTFAAAPAPRVARAAVSTKPATDGVALPAF